MRNMFHIAGGRATLHRLCCIATAGRARAGPRTAGAAPARGWPRLSAPRDVRVVSPAVRVAGVAARLQRVAGVARGVARLQRGGLPLRPRGLGGVVAALELDHARQEAGQLAVLVVPWIVLDRRALQLD